MKKTLLTLVTILSVLPFIANAQWTTSGTNIHNSNTGNVGIGTTTLGTLLSVGKDSGNGTTDVQRYLNLANGSAGAPVNGNGVGMSFSVGNNYNTSAVLGAIDVVNEYYNITSNMRFYTVTGSTLTEKMRLDGSGNLGIGTTSPATTLEVQNQTGGWLVNLRTYAASPGNINGLKFYSGYVGENKWSGISSVCEDINSNHTALALYSNQAESMRIAANGNVSIGTTDPHGYKLAVNGDAIANSMTVKLYANWPDYVFKPTYQLPKLSDVKTYIDQNQHLPEMPSKVEVQKDGINLGEMNKLLVKKVEELTLYLIEQSKKDTERQAELTAQKEKMKLLEQRLTQLEAVKQ